MVVDLFLTIVKTVVTGVIALIPAGSAPDLAQRINDAHTLFGGGVGLISWIVPVHAMVAGALLLVTWWGICTGYRLVLWMLGKLHITGSTQ